MATVHVLVGQCGNQLGSAFLQSLAEEGAGRDEQFRSAQECLGSEGDCSPSFLPYHTVVSTAHFRPPLGPSAGASRHRLPEPRCVLVDMEHQVVSRLLHGGVDSPVASDAEQQDEPGLVPEPMGTKEKIQTAPSPPLFQFSPRQCVTRSEGSGNNWAYGYHHQGRSTRKAMVECLRRELECSDTVVRTLHVMHSIAGGTGSGVGCLVGEVIKDLLPRTTLLYTSVWPFENGEVATQWFNLCLSLSALRDTADAVQLFFNDEVVEELARYGCGGLSHSNSTAAALHELGLDRINRYLSGLMLPLHLPQFLYDVPPPQLDESLHRIAGVSRHAPPLPTPLRRVRAEDLLESLAIDPAMKFFTATAVPRGSTASNDGTTWTGVLSEAARTAHQHFLFQSAFPTPLPPRLCCLWSLRGPAAPTEGLRALQHVLAKEPRAAPLSSLWLHPSYSPSAATSHAPPRQAHLFGHTASIATHAECAARKAEDLLHAAAYVHHYEQYGVEKDNLLDAVAVTYDVAAAYE